MFAKAAGILKSLTVHISTRAPPTDAIYALQMFVDYNPHHTLSRTSLELLLIKIIEWPKLNAKLLSLENSKFCKKYR